MIDAFPDAVMGLWLYLAQKIGHVESIKKE